MNMETFIAWEALFLASCFAVPVCKSIVWTLED